MSERRKCKDCGFRTLADEHGLVTCILAYDQRDPHSPCARTWRQIDEAITDLCKLQDEVAELGEEGG